MPAFRARTKDGVCEWLAKSFEKDPRLSFVGDPDSDERVACRYRGENGTRCAFGRSVTDRELGHGDADAYEDWYEGMNAADLILDLEPAVRDTFLAVADGDWWNMAQRIHDSVAQQGKRYGVDGSDLHRLYRRWREMGYPMTRAYADTLRMLTT